MATQKSKRIGGRPAVKEPVSLSDTLHDTWTVLKPFVYFSIKAMRVVAHVLIFIVKNIPKPETHKPSEGGPRTGPGKDKIIKI